MIAVAERAPSPGSLPSRTPVPPWHRAAVAALLVATAALYLWDLSASGWANAYYSAAAQAGTQSWKALLFGSSDAANAITVDKPPASLWIMGLSARLFGVGSWSILVPQALMGVGSVWLLYATVRRTDSPAAGLLAGSVLALTPAAALMFRFNNPDALLVLLLTAAAYCVVRALERGRLSWLLLAGTAVGFGFLTKMLQAFLVLPAFALVYLVAAPLPLGRRLAHLLAAAAAVVVSAGWYVALVELWPASGRPYVGGSQGNSILELTLGYNGLGRLTGDEVGSVGGGMGGGWGETGWNRLLGDDMGGGIAWLLPAALLAVAAGLWAAGRAPRTDRGRAGYLLWGGWLVVTAAVFSYMGGIIHSYYTVALAPAVAALTGAAGVQLWRRRGEPVAAGLLAGGVALSALTANLLLRYVTAWPSWPRALLLVAGLTAAGLIPLAARLSRAAARAVAVLALVSTLTGTGAYTVATAATPHTGALPAAGPSSGRFGGGPGGTQGGGPGGLLEAGTPDPELTALLTSDAGDHTWAAATVGSNNAAGLQLATGLPVLAVGGFNGTDPWPTLEEFQRYVSAGRIHYFVGGGMGMTGDSGSDAAQRIAAWVATTFPASTVGGQTVYDLTSSTAVVN